LEILQDYLRRGAQTTGPRQDDFPEHTGYVVIPIQNVQGGAVGPPFDRYYGRATPVQVISVHGVPYVWIYKTPPPAPRPRSANFGDAIQLRGFDIDGPAQPGAPMTITLFWGARAAPAADYMLFVHLIGADGQRAAQADPPLSSGSWGPGRFFTTSFSLALPAALPDGVYQLAIGLYDPASGQRLPITAIDPGSLADDGPQALKLTELVFRAGKRQ
jgi:hypothetical protein